MACISEGEVPASANRYQLTGSEDDAGITARLAKKLIAWTSPEAGKLEAIRPGTFTAQYIRSTGLKSPVLIKGDRFNESPQLGLMWPDVHNISVDVLSDYIGGDRKVDTWDVMKQRPGPAWTLSQWCTYWHARLDAATRQARPATAHGAPGMLVNEDDDEEGEVVDSGVVIVLQGMQGAPHSRYNPAPACVGISPEQAQRLLDGECLPLHGSQLCQHIHPPPAIQSVDLVRQVEKDLEAVGRDISNKQNQSAVPAKSDAPRVGAAAAAAAETSRDGSMLGHKRGDAGKNQEGQPFKFTPLAINPADTLHLQMSPKDCFSDFRMAPGGAATWLYVLKGVKVVVLIPPTVRNRRLFLTWATATRANQPKENVLVECLLADYAEAAVKVELKASQALIIPAGWFYASAVITDTLAVGCFFWHPYCLADSARVQQMESQLKLKPQRFSLPARNLLWYVGIAYGSKLRKEFGLPDLRVKHEVANARHSVSEASLNQQQRVSPYLRGLPGPAAAGGSSEQRRRLVRNAGGSVTPSTTPPLVGMHTPGQQQQQHVEAFSGLASPAGTRTKRGRQSDVMEQLYLGDAAVPVAAAEGQQQQQQQQLKRIRLANGKPTTPLLTGVAAAAGAAGTGLTASAISTPHSTSRPVQQNPAVAAAVPSSSNQSGRLLRLQNGAGGLPGVQQQLLHTPRGRGRYAVMDDDDEGECHTSPVRKPEPDPLDDAAAAGDGFIDWGTRQPEQQQQQRGYLAAAEVARPITALKIRVPGKAQPMYSPVIQPVKGDLDSIPPLSEQQLQPAAVTPTGTAARKAAEKAIGLLPPPAAGTGAAAGTATPGRKKLTLKGQGTPTAAAAAAAGGNVVWPGSSPAPAVAVTQPQQPAVRRKSSPDQESSAGSHAVSAEVTHTSGGQQQLSGAARAKAQQQQQHRRVVLEPVSDDEDDEQQQQAAARVEQLPKQPQLPPAAGAAVQQRRVSDSGAPRPVSATAGATATPTPAGTGMKAPMKLKFKLASPSPKLAILPAPQVGSGVPPALSLDAQPAAAAVPPPQQQQQQADSTPGIQQAAVVPQVDGAAAVAADQMDMDDVVLQGQLAMQQLLQRQQPQQQLLPPHQQSSQQLGLWARWQQVQSSVHAAQQHSHLASTAVATAGTTAAAPMIPQVDGAGDDGCPVSVGPTLVLQPATAPITAVNSQPLANGAVLPAVSQPLAGAPQQQRGYVGQVAAAPAVVTAANGFSTPPAMQQLQDAAQVAAASPAAKHQQQQEQQLTAASTLPTQQGLVIPKNPMLQPQVQKLRQAAVGKASSPDAGSPRDRLTVAAGGHLQQHYGHLGTSVAGLPPRSSPRPAAPGSAAAAASEDVQMADIRGLHDAPSFTCWTDQNSEQAAAAAQPAAAAGDAGGFSRAGSSSLPVLAGAAAAAGVPAAASQLHAPAPITRRSSIGVMGDSTATTIPRSSPPSFPAAEGANVLLPQLAAAAPQQQQVQQQQQGAMGPPPPTKLSTWEVLELPMVMELLQEQVVEKLTEVPNVDLELVNQQLQETMVEVRRREEEQQNSRVSPQPVKPQQQQQQQPGTAPMSEAEMRHLQEERGPLMVLPLAQDEMPAGFWEYCRLGQQLLRANGALTGLGGDLGDQHDTTTEVVGDHDPHEGSVGAGSWDNRSAGSIGGSRGVGPAAVAAGDVGRAGRLGDAVGGRHQQVKRAAPSGAVPLGVQQAKNLKKQQLLKGIGIKR